MKNNLNSQIVMLGRQALGVCTLLLACSAQAQDVASASCEPAADASRIAIAGGSITEIFYDLNEQDRIVAVDRTSNYPPAATELPSVGYVRNLSAEGILSLSPTLILGEDDMGPAAVVTQLFQTGLDVRRLGEVHTAEGIIAKVDCVTQIIGLSEDERIRARNALAPVLAQLDQVQRDTPPKVALIFSLSDGVPTAGGTDTSATGVIEMAGGQNVFDEFAGWKPVSLEALAEAGPDYIIMPERGLRASGGMQAVLDHPAIKLTPAGAEGRIVAIDGMTLLGFGPRTLGAAVDLALTFGTLEQ